MNYTCHICKILGSLHDLFYDDSWKNICECLQWNKTYNCEHVHFSCASWKTFSSVSFTTKTTLITSVGGSLHELFYDDSSQNICECLQWSKTYNCEHVHFSCASWKTFSSVSFTTKATFITSVGENGAHGSNGIIKTSTWKWRRPVNNLKEKKQTNCISFFIVNASLRSVIFLFLAFTVIW